MSDIPDTRRAIVLQNYVNTEVDLSSSPSSTFAVRELPIPDPLPEDTLLVKTLYFSNDPAQRLWLQSPGVHSGARKDMVALPLNEPFQAFSLSRVVKVSSENGLYKVGDIVEARMQWADYDVVDLKKSSVTFRKEIPGVGLSAYLGVLGLSGATAYMALTRVLKPKVTDTLVVSGAAGAVGNVAVQYAKNVLGVKRVIGIAGSDEKCEWLKRLGADEAVNYKSKTFADDLAKATPDKVDLFFDNVGGDILDEVMLRMNPHGIIAVVGAISLYNKLDQPATLRSYMKVVSDRLSIIGCTVMDYIDQIAEADEALTNAVLGGKISLDGAETIVNVQGRLEEVPRVWTGLFSGANTGKLITKLSE